MEWYSILTLVLAAGAFIFTLVLVLRKRPDCNNTKALEARVQSLAEQISREFLQSRQENAGTQALSRKEQSDALLAMRQELAREMDGVKQGLSKALDSLFTQSREQADAQSRSVRESVRQMQENNEKKLEQMRTTVDEKLSATLNERLGASFKQVSEQLTSVYTALGEMKSVGEGVSGLQRLLTNVSVRGAWAETQLENILSQTLPGHFERQFALDGHSSQRVDFAVRIPSSDGTTIYLPVDSKFPREDYEGLCRESETGNAAGVEAYRRRLVARVRQEAQSIAEKYIQPPKTTPYAILYLPTEGLFAELCRSGAMDEIQDSCHVLLAGPTTITALLNAVSAGFRAVAINQKANEIQRILAAAKVQFGKFGEILEKAEKQIRTAGETLYSARTTRLNAVDRELRGIEQLDAGESARLLGIGE
ncbi:MAG: DNA recombination protein RmuC [Oscillospiraceae bacterium]|jgi:DNA recombination protein RmuC|nr:DNA recombination protein RmuC [Oscillospiraceae bacterium]